MKTISIALDGHYAQGSTTIARCWKATRTDGFILAVTTCTRDLLVDGLVYRAAQGFDPRAISQEASAAVMNTEVFGSLNDAEMAEVEFEAGKWDNCEVEIFEVNYRAVSEGKLTLATMNMGNIAVTRAAFKAEMRGLTERLQKTLGRTVTKGCPYVLGDPATCKVDLAPLTVTGTLTSVTSRRTFADSTRTEPDDWFGAGVVTMTSGENAGQSLEVYDFDGDTGTFTLHLPYAFNPAEGDTYEATPGCRKNFTPDCVGKFANGNNFGGFPFLPGNDRAFGLGGTEGTNL
jgi:uncharacterized phage protein (TIGR02218 family)